MKLFDVPQNTKIKVLREIGVPPAAPEILEGQILNFHHIDGMYSYCTDDRGKVYHLVAWAEVKIVKE